MKLKLNAGVLADAVGRAAKMAPNKGVAYDKAHGIVLEGTDEMSLVVYANNLEVRYREVVPMVEVTAPGTWRIPSSLLAGVIAGLPPEQDVTMDEKSDGVHIKAGKKRARLRTIDLSGYELWDEFDTTDLKPVDNFAERVTQVAWGVDTQNVPFTGVHFTGSKVIATNRYRGAMVPCTVPLEYPVTVALAMLTPILKGLPAPFAVRAEDDLFHIACGSNIQVQATLFAPKYPDVEGSLRTDFTLEATLDRKRTIEAIQNMLVLVGSERYPLLRTTFTRGSMELHMEVKEVGEMDDVLGVDYESDEEFTIDFTPDFVVAALDGATHDIITMRFGPDPGRQVEFKDEDDYIAWVMPRHSSGKGTSSEGDDG